MESDDYWNTSQNKSFSFDDDNFEEKVQDDNISEISNVSSSLTLNLRLIIDEEDLVLVLEEQMITEPIFPKVPLEEEVKILRRKLNESQYCPVHVTVNKMLLGKPCSLAMYRSLSEKQQLLDGAIQCGDGDAVLQVVIFLKNTLKPSLFNQILRNRPSAVDQYLNFLNTTMKIGDASELLKMQGRNLEAIMVQFKAESSSKNVIQKLEKLKKLGEQFNNSNCNPFLAQQVQHYCSLLELQINDRLYFQPHDMLDKPVVETLYYCCEKFQKWSDPSSTALTNPFRMVEKYSVTPSQFEWIALNSRGKSQAWRDIEGLFEKKSMLKKNNFAIHIPLELAILRLFQLRAPQAVLNCFLKHIDDPERRLALSKKVGAIHSIVESFSLLKDKKSLEDFKETLASGTAEYYYAENAITSLSTSKSLLGLRKNTSMTS